MNRDDALRHLNDLLRDNPVELTGNGNVVPEMPSFHVVGLPRSGTTVATQIATNSLELAYISNATALFWEDPVLGAIIMAQMFPFMKANTLQSDLGRTSEPTAPHEAGRFWRSVLGYSKNQLGSTSQPGGPDWNRLRKVIAQLQCLADAPFLGKNFLWLDLGAELLSEVPHSYIVILERDPEQVAASLLMARSRAADPQAWIGPLPAEDPGERSDPIDLVAFQVSRLQRRLETLFALDESRVVRVRYQDLASDPRRFVECIVNICAVVGVSVRPRFMPEKSLQVSEPFSLLPADQQSALRAALENERRMTQ